MGGLADGIGGVIGGMYGRGMNPLKQGSDMG